MLAGLHAITKAPNIPNFHQYLSQVDSFIQTCSVEQVAYIPQYLCEICHVITERLRKENQARVGRITSLLHPSFDSDRQLQIENRFISREGILTLTEGTKQVVAFEWRVRLMGRVNRSELLRCYLFERNIPVFWWAVYRWYRSKPSHLLSQSVCQAIVARFAQEK